MASFDVSSLFTNVPLDESIEICVSLLFNESDTIRHQGCTFTRDNFRSLLNFAVKDSQSGSQGRTLGGVGGGGGETPPNTFRVGPKIFSKTKSWSTTKAWIV